MKARMKWRIRRIRTGLPDLTETDDVGEGRGLDQEQRNCTGGTAGEVSTVG
jgi:hypothetical protein